MREIKFRAWDKVNKNMLYDVSTGTVTIWYKEISSKSQNCVFMQYTGLKDANGKDIYEGDIVKYSPSGLYQVKWQEEKTGFYPFIDDNDSLYHTNGIGSSNVEVIGNIYENPELLESDIIS